MAVLQDSLTDTRQTPLPEAGEPSPEALGNAGAGQSAQLGVFPLSFAQESLWFVEQIAPGSPAYNMTEGWRLKGTLAVDVLRQSLNELVQRHEALRTVFCAKEGTTSQVILAPRPFDFPFVDLQGCADGETQVRRLLEEEARLPFDLGSGPLMRIRLFSLGHEEHVLVINMHHIISDAWSFGVFMRELAVLCGTRLEGNGSPL